MKIFEINSNVDIKQNIIWQYENSNALKTLIELKQKWYNKNYTQFWNDWAKNVLNLSTANDFGLKIWGLLLNVSRIYNINGVQTTLTTEQYRMILKARLFYMTMNCSVPSINRYIKNLLQGKGTATINNQLQDNQDMTINYVLDYNPSEEDIAIFFNTDVLPRPAGVKLTIYVVDVPKTFGFNGSNMQPFNQGQFWDGTPINQ